MFDGTKVILDAYGRLLKKNNNIFRNNFRRGEVYNNGTRGIDCRRLPVVPWEHGDKIFKNIKQVSPSPVHHQPFTSPSPVHHTRCGCRVVESFATTTRPLFMARQRVVCGPRTRSSGANSVSCRFPPLLQAMLA